MTPPFIVVSDFDGTITTSDLVAALTTRVCESNRQVVLEITQGQLGLHEGLDLLFSRLPSGDRGLYEEYLRHLARFRSGYHRFRGALTQARIPFYVVSNGLDFMLDAILGQAHDDRSQRICNKAHFDQPGITIEWQYPCADPCPGGCGLCKHAVVSLLRAQHQAPVAYIGDGLTDINGAKNADRVFARSSLARRLQADGIAYTPFETFDDVLEKLFRKEGTLSHE